MSVHEGVLSRKLFAKHLIQLGKDTAAQSGVYSLFKALPFHTLIAGRKRAGKPESHPELPKSQGHSGAPMGNLSQFGNLLYILAKYYKVIGLTLVLLSKAMSC